MKVYTVSRLEEPDMNMPGVTIHGVYADEKAAIRAMAEWIVEIANTSESFKESLQNDQNHEDFPEEWDDGKVVEYIVGEYGGAYYVFDDFNDTYNFDVNETEFFG